MWETISPKQAGYNDSDIIEYIEILEKYHLSTHSLILAKGDKIFYEGYWAPFHRDFMHRMYSVTKSLVSIAIGFARQDGLLKLDDRICDYFSEYVSDETPEEVKNQTIRDMLTMSTAGDIDFWFDLDCDDRVAIYFKGSGRQSRPTGTIFQYDSPGSFVMGALVERLTGKTVMEYLFEKAFDKIGVSKNAHMLKCPGGHSWSDSSLLCTPRDLLKIAHFTMNLGCFNDEQLLDREYLREATSKIVDNNIDGLWQCDRQGYGYQFWKTYGDAFFFNGMGSQYAICVPHKDLIMIYNADTQGVPSVKNIVIDNFFRIFVDKKPFGASATNLAQLTSSLKLAVAWGQKSSPFASEVNGREYILDENPMGITKMKLVFDETGGRLLYTNAQGDKELLFGMCENAFSKFPQSGYSDTVGGKVCPGHKYNCATSAAWVEEKKLTIKCQIIDEYFGNMTVTLSFKDKLLGVYMQKNAEAFLNEYQGFALGRLQE